MGGVTAKIIVTSLSVMFSHKKIPVKLLSTGTYNTLQYSRKIAGSA